MHFVPVALESHFVSFPFYTALLLRHFGTHSNESHGEDYLSPVLFSARLVRGSSRYGYRPNRRMG
jgi:hypothetical protein